MTDVKRLTREQLENQLLRALEHMSDAFYMIDRQWNFSYLNRTAAGALQRKRRELIGRNVWEAFPEATTTDLYPNYLQAMNSGESCHFELHYPTLNEWFEINGYPSEDGLAVYFRPISERKQIERRLLESDERFRLVAQATVDTIWDWNLQTGEVWWNDGMATMFGYAPEDLEPDGRSWTERIHPDDHDATVAYISAVVKDRSCTRWEHEYRFRRKNGDYALVNDRGFVIRDHRGWGLRMVGGMSDITEHRKLEQRLQDAQRMEAIGQLTGGMAHDFNNLLTVILGNAELLADALGQQPDLRPLAELITSAASRGADLTQRLLAFARRQALTPSPTDINERLPELQALLNSTLGDGIQLKVRPGPELWQALIDPTQLESALLNLCLNARDAMPGGGVLTIETTNVSVDEGLAQQVDGLTPGDYIRLSVSDTGSGIDPAIQQRVFEPFFSTKGAGRGTGLGLSMVYGFLKQSGGHVSLYSEPGTGTTVNLYLPRTESHSEPSQRGSGKTPVTGGQELILLAEDDPMVRGYVLKQLQTAGYRILEASSGPEALALLRQQQTVDLLFTDVMMPGGMTGPQLAAAARQLCPGLPVLYTSGYTEDAMGENGQLPANVYLLNKPYRRADLLRMIREVLDGPH